MDIFNVLSLIGGLSLFLFGMNIMGSGLERSAGGKLESLLSKLTTGRFVGLFTGLAVTAVIQSSSATTVMVVGFVNSGLMSLRQAINVIMGANVGTTVTAWILSLGGISSSNIFIKFLKPSSFAPVLALAGIILYMFFKENKKKDIGSILLGFTTLMTGMDLMSGAVSGLKDVPAFGEIFLLFQNPFLGVLAGAVLTAIIQSSSASVGILQALSSTGQITLGASIPIIMGQNIGTCVTALISSIGANKNARRAALVHLFFNIVGTLFWLIVYWAIDLVFSPALFDMASTHASIAAAHTYFNIACTALLLPASSLLEKLAYRIVPETHTPVTIAKLDERLLQTPAIALERSRALVCEMAQTAVESIHDAMECLSDYTVEKADRIVKAENFTDQCEEQIGDYLVKLSENRLSNAIGAESATILKIIGDIERLGDHAVNVLESAEEIRDKKIRLTPEANGELDKIISAVNEILTLTLKCLSSRDLDAAHAVDPLEEVIDQLREKLRSNHILRLQRGECSISAGFVWSDILTNLERISDHCSNIALSIIDNEASIFHGHESINISGKDNALYKMHYESFKKKYL
ncbi:MAG: Na/Pi cotransporter family protein [Clostridiales bacterium]|nr:Na/Pi cotransporter family protein [Clostridiales bacterium]